MQQQHRRAVTRPPFPRQGGAVPADIEAFRHDSMLPAAPARRQINSAGPSSSAGARIVEGSLARMVTAGSASGRPAPVGMMVLRSSENRSLQSWSSLTAGCY
jgi:hypothetical protein